jgi:hypothetical protein
MHFLLDFSPGAGHQPTISDRDRPAPTRDNHHEIQRVEVDIERPSADSVQSACILGDHRWSEGGEAVDDLTDAPR